MDINEICKKYNIKNYTINSDGSIDVNGDVNLYNKGLTELPLVFNKVSGYFDCSNNQLTSLKGCPRWVGSSFYCTYNNLTSLEFSPDYVGNWFNCKYNQLTDNLCDTEIGGRFYTTLKQDGLIFSSNKATNYNEWRKLYKRKLILDDIFNM
jgi:Leucine-rich repeat (LRR) protein